MKSILILAIAGMLLFSCEGERLGEPYAYGKVAVTQVSLPDSPALLDVYIDGKNSGMVSSSGTSLQFVLSADKPVQLAIYKSATDTLLADTLITVPKNETVNLKVISSKLLGLQGFYNSPATDVGVNEVRLQFMYLFDSPFYTYPELDLHILIGTTEETGIVIKGLKAGKLNSQTITLPVSNDGVDGIRYYCKLKDVATGEFIKQKYKDRDYFLILNTGDYFQYYSYPGPNFLIQLYDDDGDETTNRISNGVYQL